MFRLRKFQLKMMIFRRTFSNMPTEPNCSSNAKSPSPSRNRTHNANTHNALNQPLAANAVLHSPTTAQRKPQEASTSSPNWNHSIFRTTTKPFLLDSATHNHPPSKPTQCRCAVAISACLRPVSVCCWQ